MARRLSTIAAWINDNRPELSASIDAGYCNTDRHPRGVTWRIPGKGRYGWRIIVKRVSDGEKLLDHNGAEAYRRNDEVERWLADYLEKAP